MIASASAVVEAGGVLRHAHSAPPLTIRQVLSEDRGTCALCLVGSAAGPLAGDEIHLDLTVGEGARAHLTSAGATLAQGRPGGRPATIRIDVRLGPEASLVAEIAPLVVCAGSRVDVRLGLDLASSATLRWRELLVLGRSGEPAGAVTLDWQVRREGRAVLRQTIDLTAPEPWSGLLRGHRVLATELIVGTPAETLVVHDRAVAQRISADVTLLTVLADDAAEALASLQELTDRLEAAASGSPAELSA